MQPIRPAEFIEEIPLPLFIERVSCGFPGPAQDYVEARLDLNKMVVRHPSTGQSDPVFRSIVD